jgi:threonine dehydrogenase-like Zn-dependent dehydrogenase
VQSHAKRMRAQVIEGPGRTVLRRMQIPEPGANEVRVRLEGSGVCASNLPLWRGQPWFSYPARPGAPGHEGWGVVDAVGPNVREPEPGARVALISECAYAEYDVAPAANVVPLPQSLKTVPFPGEPLGCAVNIFERCDIKPGQTVAIVGIGFLGALLTRLASRSGARVIAISRRPYALEVARGFGAAETVSLDVNSNVIERVRALTSGGGCERVIEAVGNQHALDLASELTAERARLIIAGYHQDGPRQINLQLWNWRGLDVINAHERDPIRYVTGIRAAVDLVVSGALDPFSLITHRFALEELEAAFRTLSERPPGFMKAVVMT